EGDMAEFETEEAATGLEDTASLGEGQVDVRDIAQAKGDGDRIDAARLDGKPLGIADDPFDALQHAVVERAVAADRQHGLRQITDDGEAIRPLAGEPVEAAQRDVAGPARDVEQGLARPWIEPVDELGLPEPVD